MIYLKFEPFKRILISKFSGFLFSFLFILNPPILAAPQEINFKDWNYPLLGSQEKPTRDSTLNIPASTKVILIDFWASWCEPCKESFPFYLKLKETYKDKLLMVAVSEDDEKSPAEAFLKEHKTQSYFDAQKKLVNLLDIQAVPTLFIVLPNGQIQKVVRGWGDSKKEDIKKTIDQLMNPSK